MSVSDALRIRHLVASGDRDSAQDLLSVRIEALIESAVRSVRISSDEYSLNSVSGTAVLDGGETLFFKFHVEEGEESAVGEYYRANVLHQAGLPVDVPIASSCLPGQQLVLYKSRTEERLVDVCKRLEESDPSQAHLPPDILNARRRLDEAIGRVAVESLHVSAIGEGQRSSIHQLFSTRMHDGDRFPGGRLAAWYTGRSDWRELSRCTWVIDGIEYQDSLDTIIERARFRLDPYSEALAPVVTAHGDDHNGNVWVTSRGGFTELSMFDPAFAGEDVPALLALVKATFHNVFAHPDWLYHHSSIDPSRIRLQELQGKVDVVFDSLSPLRVEILNSLIEEAWIPLLIHLARRGWLDPEWRATVRSALAMCPLLVTDLMSPARSHETQMLGLAKVVQMGSEPVFGADELSMALDRIQEAVGSR